MRLDENKKGPHETFLIIRPFLEEHGIIIEAYENREIIPNHAPAVWLRRDGWQSGARLLMADGTKIKAPGGVTFDLHDPGALPRLVRYLNQILTWPS
jgi:hypothetical protein